MMEEKKEKEKEEEMKEKKEEKVGRVRGEKEKGPHARRAARSDWARMGPNRARFSQTASGAIRPLP